MTKSPRDIAASVRQRLLNLAKKRNEDFQAVLTRYALERLLYRLASSSYRDEFILKGAMLFTLWSGEPHRATWDVDFLGCGEPAISRLEAVFRDVCGVAVENDGLVFQGNTVHGERIREDQVYEGIRIHLTALLGVARAPLQIDIGFGDAVTPGPEEITFPTLLEFEPPRLKAYPRESVIAEKFQAMVVLGIGNSRMKDFFDIWSLAQQFAFEGSSLSAAIRATFERRRTALPTQPPLALTEGFSSDRGKQTQWSAFIRKGRLSSDAPSLSDVVNLLREFLMLPSDALMAGHPFLMQWPAGGPWRAR